VNWCSRTAAGYVLLVHAQPGAKRSEIVGLHGERLKIRIAAPAVEGRANEALVEFLAARLGIPRAKVRVAHGLQGRTKRIEIDDADADPAALLTP
jgi:uncharacterized protein (TIGR00251 family)